MFLQTGWSWTLSQKSLSLKFEKNNIKEPDKPTVWTILRFRETPTTSSINQLCGSDAQSFLTLCDPMDCSPPGSSVHGILQARVLEWVAISFSKEAPHARGQTHLSCIGKWVLYH